MKFISTRGASDFRSFTDLLTCGTAEDGGLYMPEKWPERLSLSNDELACSSYVEIVMAVLAAFAGGMEDVACFKTAITSAFAKFDTPDGPPLNKLEGDLWTMELFNGPTFAFKDYALFPIAEMISSKLKDGNQNATVLCATSGDTGASTVAAFARRDNLKAVVLFPLGRVSPLQQLQMTTSGAENILVLGVDGDFDDCQRIVKELYKSKASGEHNYTAVNSINLVRILLQSAYYLQTAAKLYKQTGKHSSFIVPTGNFGNIFAAHIAKQLGVPIDHLIASSNENDILPRAFSDGRMERKSTQKTISPSMDIQISSNFERAVWTVKNSNGNETRAAHTELEQTGAYYLPLQEVKLLKESYSAIRCDTSQAQEAMQTVRNRFDKIICPHTATAAHVALNHCGNLESNIVIVETAHPAKFPNAVIDATGIAPDTPPALARLQHHQTPIAEVESGSHAALQKIHGAGEQYIKVKATACAVQNAIDDFASCMPAGHHNKT